MNIADHSLASFEKTAVFDTAISDTSYADWKPPGELWKTIQSRDQTYEIWKGSLADLAVQQMIKRIQIMVPFFIEGGTFIELEDPALDRWTVFFLYQKKTVDVTASPYVFMGYSTIYKYFYYQPIATNSPPSATKQRISHPANLDFQLPLPQSKDTSFSCRSRISQFLILPPFQGGGNGSRFYNAIFDFYLHEPQTIEITVEDPNESFDDLRDLNDLTLLRTLPEFTTLRINTSVTLRAKGPVPRNIVDLSALEALRKKMKIAPRQFYRVVEMQLLSLIPTSVRQSLLLEQERKKEPNSAERKKEYHLWQLWVKKRLYKHNKDTLMQLDRVERIEKLEQALGGVEADYARLLRALDSRGKGKAVVGNGEGSASGANGKRSSPDDVGIEGEEPVAKKVKFAE